MKFGYLLGASSILIEIGRFGEKLSTNFRIWFSLDNGFSISAFCIDRKVNYWLAQVQVNSALCVVL